MSAHVSIEPGPEGGTVACKRATSPGHEAAIRAEAERLTGLDHPGVVRLVGLREDDDGPRLVTEYVGPRTLATMGRVTTERAAALVADLATTVADLHARGEVHGALGPEHVLVAGDRTVLCGFSADADHEPADDVHGIGQCLQALLEPDLDEEPIPDRRPWRRTPWVGYRHRALLTLADQATADEPGRRPAARALADAVRAVVGEAAERPPSTRSEPHPARLLVQQLTDLVAVRLRRHPSLARPPHPASGRRRTAVLAGAGLVVATVGAVGITARAPRTAAETPLAATSPPPACTPVTGAGADLDGDGCPEGIELGRGWIDVDGERFLVGRPGNALAVGDWDGDGRATVALLQRGSGQVWTFPTWDPDGPVTAEPLGAFPGAVDLTGSPQGGHDELVVRLRNGTTEAVPA